jgi:hypothetical protein
MSRPKRILTNLEKEKICQDYLSGVSLNKITKENKLQKSQTKQVLMENNIKVLTVYESKIKNAKEINVHCLDGDTELSAYVLGLIFGDGHVNFDEIKYKYYVSLISIDYDIVQSAQTLFGIHFPIKTIKPNTKKKKLTYNIVVNSKEFSIYLRKQFQLVNKKSDCLIWPSLPEKMYQFFISGLLSTDGCIRVDKRRLGQPCGIEFSYSSNCLQFIKDLRSYISNIFNYPDEGYIKTLPKNKKRKNANYNLRYSGSKALAILNWIYDNTNNLTRCKRKYEIYQNYLASVSNSIM